MSRHSVLLAVASTACAAVFASCAGGGGTRTVAPPAVTSAAPAVTYTLSAGTTSRPVPAAGGYSGTIALQPVPGSGDSEVTLSAATADTQSDSSSRSTLDAGRTPLYIITFTPSTTIVVTGLPQLSLMLPPSISTANEQFFYQLSALGRAEPPFPLTVGPATVSGQMLTFAASTTPLTFHARKPYVFTFYEQRVTAAQAIQHVVIIFQENRTVDNLFNGFPGADTVRSGLNSQGQTVALQPIDMTAPYDLDHSHHGFVTEYDDGKMDGFDEISSTLCSACPPKTVRAYGFVPQSQVQPYWTMAQQYALADRMFQTNQGPSFPAHQYIISGTSIPSDGSALKAAENPTKPAGGSTGGCDSPAGSLVAMIDPSGSEATKQYPCFDHPTLMDAIDAKQLTWRYYESFRGPGLWMGPDAIQHIRFGSGYADVVAPSSTIFSDIAAGQLPSVSWVIPTAAESDHALSTDGSGPSWVASIVNAIGASPYWSSTAIFVTWDDWGGWYDHVKPFSYNSYELSFRVPLIVVSPYAKHGYVSHVQHEYGSILKFTEETFGLNSLNYTDARADDLADCFDFSQQPSTFRAVAAPISAAAFLRQPVSPTIPDDDF